jgi:hypothetical protein
MKDAFHGGLGMKEKAAKMLIHFFTKTYLESPILFLATYYNN